jgi:D-sedoheptulose 7-phosphate isomerase
MNLFFKQYRADVSSLLEQVNDEFLNSTLDILLSAYQNDKQIFIVGNGGSAAIANHFACDLAKNSISNTEEHRFRIFSLCSNTSSILAIANDLSVTEVFRQQLIHIINKDDILLVISASGKSMNLVKACEYAKSRGATLITMSGFSGGKIAKYADCSLCLDTESYGGVEDVVHIVLHAIVSYFRINKQLLVVGEEDNQ